MPEEKMIEVPDAISVEGAAGLLDDFAGEILEEEDPGKRSDREAHGAAEDEADVLEAAGDDELEAEAEAEGDDDLEEYDDEESGESEDRAETYTVRVGGAEVEVSWDELIAGYSRTADYTRKTQAVATERKLFEQEQTAVREERQEYGKRLEVLQQTLASNQPEEPSDPAAWIEWKKGQEQLQAVAVEQARLHQKLQDENLAEQKATVAHEAKLLRDAIPEWKDEGIMNGERTDMVSYATGLGYTEEDLQGLTDHRAVLVLRKAMLYDQQSDGRKSAKKKVAASPTLKPGRPKAKKSARRKGIERRAERLSKSGHQRDAASLIESIMGDDEFGA